MCDSAWASATFESVRFLTKKNKPYRGVRTRNQLMMMTWIHNHYAMMKNKKLWRKAMAKEGFRCVSYTETSLLEK
jgi:hypothetical protein